MISQDPAEQSAAAGQPMSQIEKSFAAHLAGLRTWGIRRLPCSPSAMSATADGSKNVVAPSVQGHTQSAATDPFSTLASCAAEVAGCQRCRLAETRTNTVFGVGHHQARLMFVGEAPGQDEDLQGEPFVGAAGQLLNKIIGAMGLRREDVYIANVLKCRPPGNRDPRADEVAACTGYLVRQIELVAPEVIVALGKPAAHFLTGTDESLGRLRQRRHEYHGVPVVVTYHPAYLLRSPAEKRKTWQDMQGVMADLGLPVPGR